MTDNTLPQQDIPPVVQDEDEISLLDLLIVLAKRKKMILGIPFVVAIIAAGISLLLPNIYTASVKILPPQTSQSGGGAMLAQLGGMGGLGGLAGGALGLKRQNDVYLAMLKSRPVVDGVIRQFDLQKRYKAKTMTDVRNRLQSITLIADGKDGVIAIEVADQDPKFAAEIANSYVEELKRMIRTFAVTESSQRRMFFEAQLKPTRDKLTDAEVVLDKTPATSLNYRDAFRNLKYQEALYEVLAKQYEAARLDEAKDAASIQVLEAAIEPEKKSKPKRSQIVLLSAFAALFLAILWAFVKEASEKAKADPVQAERLRLFRKYWSWK